MSRVRLTDKRRAKSRNAVDSSIPYPGNVNQPGRTDHEWDEYHTFVQTINHELPDMRTEWKEETRNEIGFGIPKYASIRAAASKAVKLAVLLLGDKVDEEVIEAQARDFMRLGSSGLERSLNRFAKTEKLYADDEEPAPPVTPPPAKEEEEVVTSAAEEEKKEAPVAKKAEEAPVEEKKEAPVAKKAEEAPVAKKAEEAPVEEKKEAPVAKKAEVEEKEEEAVTSAAEEEEEAVTSAEEEPEEEAVTSAEEMPEEEAPAPATCASKKSKLAELDVEFAGANDENVEMSEEDEKTLSSLYADDGIPEEEVKSSDDVVPMKEEPKAKVAKKGVKKLGGQPKVASVGQMTVSDISKIWKSEPDVSDVFG